MFATGETLSLAEWIIDDTCLVLFILLRFSNLSTILNLSIFQFKFWFNIIIQHIPDKKLMTK